MRWWMLGAVAVLLAGCVSEAAQRAPVAPDDGLALSGSFEGRRLVLSDGEPTVTLGDCDYDDGADRDLCIESFTIDGAPLLLVIENPAALEAGRRLRPTTPSAAGCAPHCDDLMDAVVIELRQGADVAEAADGGYVEVEAAGPRYVATVVLELRGGRVTGGFNVIPGSPG